MKGLRALLPMCLVAGTVAAAAQEGFPPLPTISESMHFKFATDAPASGGELDEIFEVVVERLGVSLDEKVTVAFAPSNPGACPSRGTTMFPPGRSENDPLPLIVIFADEKTDKKQIMGALAHELGHVIQLAVVDSGSSIQSIFNEGFATWAAGPYWLDWHGATSFQAAVASYIAAGSYLPLHENDGFPDTLSADAVSRFGQDCLDRRDVIYGEWAAFIEYLVDEYGRAKLYSLFQTPPLASDEDRFLRPNFAAVYGRSLEELEVAWLERVTATD